MPTILTDTDVTNLFETFLNGADGETSPTPATRHGKETTMNDIVTIVTAQTTTTGLGHVTAGAPYIIRVSAYTSDGLPYFGLVGVNRPSNVRDTVREAVRNTTGGHFPEGRLTVNLSPATVAKSQFAISAAMAVAILAAMGEAPTDAFDGTAILGAVLPDGTITDPGCTDLLLDHLAAWDVARAIIPDDSPVREDAHPGIAITRSATLTGILATIRP